MCSHPTAVSVPTLRCAHSDALVLGEAALDNLVGRQALRHHLRDLSHGVLVLGLIKVFITPRTKMLHDYNT